MWGSIASWVEPCSKPEVNFTVLLKRAIRKVEGSRNQQNYNHQHTFVCSSENTSELHVWFCLSTSIWSATQYVLPGFCLLPCCHELLSQKVWFSLMVRGYSRWNPPICGNIIKRRRAPMLSLEADFKFIDQSKSYKMTFFFISSAYFFSQ